MTRKTFWLALALSVAPACGDDGTANDGMMPAPAKVNGSLRVFEPGRAGPNSRSTKAWPKSLPQSFRDQAAALFRANEQRQQRRGAEPSSSQVNPAKTVHTRPDVEAFLPWNRRPPPDRDFVPGEVIVSLREGARDEIATLDKREGLSAYRFFEGAFASKDVLTVRFTDAKDAARTIRHRETQRVREHLARDPAFRLAELNYYRYALKAPNDERYSFQWHYPQMNLEAAWDISTGSDAVIVAVIDDGVNNHPELSRLLPGYDMVENAENAGDGDSRDNNAGNVPGGSGGQGVWHGVHVAGTVGATSDNNNGLAGVDWACKILPVRTLGLQGGNTLDVVASIRWAAGLEVPGTPLNPNIASVMNLSLGGGPLVMVEQEAIDEVTNRGAILVVAAGNENMDAQATSLAGYNNVIVVGALDYNARRAPYSNFGSAVDVMAPGGNTEADANADGEPDGVLSTYFDRTGDSATLNWLQGTSMASPHVAGLVALMKAVDPQLNLATAEQILKMTANSQSMCNEGCGSGLVNAAAALIQARGGQVVMGPPKAALSAERLNLGGAAQGQISIFNQGGLPLDWTAEVQGAALANATIMGATSGQILPGQAAPLVLTIQRSGLSDGDYQALLVIGGNGGEARAAVIFTVGQAAAADVGDVVVATVSVDANGEFVTGGAVTTNAAGSYTFDFESETGEWLLVALADVNRNNELDDGDLWGLYRDVDAIEPVTLSGGQEAGPFEFAVTPFRDFAGGGGNEPIPCGSYRACTEQCGGDPTCEMSCTIDPACDTCFQQVIDPCVTNAGCGANDLDCWCRSCEPQIDQCLGPFSCAGGGMMMMMGTRRVGEGCDAANPCLAGLSCDTAVIGGYCTADCFVSMTCPAGECVSSDTDGDLVPDAASCFATCPQQVCPRPMDTCTDLAGDGSGPFVCVP